MTKPLFTPGPWRIAEMAAQGHALNDGSIPILHDNSDQAEWICAVAAQTKPKRGERWRHVCGARNANAHLISAAPDMYEALSRLYAVATTDDTSVDWVEPVRMAKAALAKADGAK